MATTYRILDEALCAAVALVDCPPSAPRNNGESRADLQRHTKMHILNSFTAYVDGRSGASRAAEEFAHHQQHMEVAELSS